MKLVISALVIMISGICLCMDEEKYMKENNLIKCYECLSDPLDGANATCRTDVTGVRECYGKECNVLKMEFLGDDIVYRMCNGKHYTHGISRTIFSTEEGGMQRLGLKVSWSTCHENLCNSYNIKDKAVDSFATGSSVIWRTHVLTLFASVVVPLKYCAYFY
ncbi:uncharacterized protein LOC124646099 [Helicoverpa zea]|uniref:uncharacterized protein LOC124646099 n=1 Tax=Helicoverpa zea TaxID=7113 RepID=UPI001F581029|nr:uncharacterized protein LOC124646099 [Helicoverpa zea]